MWYEDEQDSFCYSRILFSISILASCSITKRVYSNGYHVEWKSGRNGADTAGSTMKAVNENEAMIVSSVKQGSSLPDEEESTVAVNDQPVNNIVSVSKVETKVPLVVPVKSIKKNIQSILHKDDPKSDQPVKKGTNPLAVTSFLSALLGVFLLMIGLTGSAALLVTGAAFGLAGLIMGILALKDTQYEKGRGLAITGTAIGGVIMAFALLFTLLFLWIVNGFHW